jgi:hypothetical protein
MRDRVVATGQHLFWVERRARHADRTEHMFPHGDIVGQSHIHCSTAGRNAHRVTGCANEQVVVLESFTQGGCGGHVGEGRHHPLGREGVALKEELNIAARDAGAVTKGIAHREGLSQLRITHRKVRQQVDEPCVPGQVAVIDERGREHGGHRLGDRADHHQRVGSHWLRAAESSDPEAIEVNDVSPLDNGDRGARYPKPE